MLFLRFTHGMLSRDYSVHFFAAELIFKVKYFSFTQPIIKIVYLHMTIVSSMKPFIVDGGITPRAILPSFDLYVLLQGFLCDITLTFVLEILSSLNIHVHWVMGNEGLRIWTCVSVKGMLSSINDFLMYFITILRSYFKSLIATQSLLCVTVG